MIKTEATRAKLASIKLNKSKIKTHKFRRDCQLLDTCQIIEHDRRVNQFALTPRSTIDHKASFDLAPNDTSKLETLRTKEYLTHIDIKLNFTQQNART